MATPQDKLSALFDPPAPARRVAPRKQTAAPSPPIDDLFDDAPHVSASSSAKPAHPHGAFDSSTEGEWSIGDAPKVKDWYRQTYGRDLPVSAFGESNTHRRMNLDHSNSMDVAMNPTSDEGQTFIGYLRENRIPFLAYDRAVPGAATAAHIHVGFPSHSGLPSSDVASSAIDDLFDAPGDVDAVARTEATVDSQTGAPLSLADSRRRLPVDAATVQVGDAPARAMPPRRSSPLDVQTTEGRATRDAGRAIEASPQGRKWIDVALPSGVRDWSELSGSDVAKATTRQWAKERGIPSEFTNNWLEANGKDLHIYDLGSGKPLETGEAMGRPDIYDTDKHTFRLSAEMPHLHKLEEDFKASRGTLTKFKDWATGDEESPGEKLLDVPAAAMSGAKSAFDVASVTPQGRFVGEAYEAVGKPALKFMDAGNTYLWAKSLGYGDQTAQTFAALSYEGIDTPMSNPLGEMAYKGLEGVNTRAATGARSALGVVAQPLNLVPLPEVGALLKAGKLGRAVEEGGELAARVARVVGMADRGLVEARPLGLVDDALSLTSEVAAYARPSAHIAPSASTSGEPLDVIMRGEDGTHYLVNTGSGEVVNLSTGELVHLSKPKPVTRFGGRSIEDIAQNSPQSVKQMPALIKNAEERAASFEAEAARATDPEYKATLAEQAARAHDDAGQIRSVMQAVDEHVRSKGGDVGGENAEVGGHSSAVVGQPPVPEKPETLRAQLNALIEGRRAVVHVTPGEKVVPPQGLRSFKDFDGGRIIYDPRQVTHDEVVAAMDSGTLVELMGHVEPKPDSPAGVVVAKHPATGAELQASYVSSPETASAQANAFASQYPGARVEVGGADLERGLLADREAAQVGDGDVIRYKGRDIVRVPMPDGTVQPFYRSTGNNSRRAGEWFPFDGVGADEQGELFLKDRFSSGEMEDPAHPLHRLGSDEMKAASERLGVSGIKPGREVSMPDEVNSWLGRGGQPNDIEDLFDDARGSSDSEWQRFPEESGSLNVPRSSMPQIKSEHRGALVQFLKGRGITHSQEEIAPNLLRPSQVEFSPSKVERASSFEGKPRSILVSSDNYVVDGHHQWLAALQSAPDAPIPVIRLDAPIQQTLIEAARFPSSGVDGASTAARAVGEAASTSSRSLVDDGKPLHEFLNDLTGKSSVDGNSQPPVPFAKRAAYASLDTVDAAKSLFASVDASAAGRQAFFPFLFDTRATAKGLIKGFPSVFERGHARFIEGLEKSALAHEAQSAGLALDSLTGTRNEFFPSSIAERIPGAGRLVSASDRLMTAQLDAVRLYNYQAWSRELRAAGMTLKDNPEEFRSVARLLNIATGKGELGRVGQAIYPGTRRVMFSPKLLKSRFQILNPLEYAGLPPAARSIALKKVGKLAAKMSGVLGLAYLTADEVGLNPMEGNFLHARYGNTTYDLSGGEANKIRFVLNLVKSVGVTAQAMRKGETINYEETPFGVTSHFLRSQLAPGYSIIPDAVTGKTYDGKEFTWTEGVVRRITPGFAQDVYDGYMEGGGWMGALKVLPSFVGVNIRMRDEEKMRKEWALAREASRAADAKEKAAVSVSGAPPHVRETVTRLKLAIPQLPRNITTEGLTGDAVQIHSKDGEQLAGLSDAEFEKLKQTYGAEVREVLADVIENPDFDSFESDADKRAHLDHLLKEHRKRFLSGVRLEARERQMGELDKLEEYQRKLESRSKQPKPGERVKF